MTFPSGRGRFEKLKNSGGANLFSRFPAGVLFLYAQAGRVRLGRWTAGFTLAKGSGSPVVTKSSARSAIWNAGMSSSLRPGELKKAANITQAAISERLGVSQRACPDWERDPIVFTSSRVAKSSASILGR